MIKDNYFSGDYFAKIPEGVKEIRGIGKNLDK